MYYHNNHNNNNNDDDDDDDDGVVGTPFAPLEADELVSRKPDLDQTVRDERGRRRFHGAFTGGFSAGYWNTVGSAEGFTPKIFRSSRASKMDKGHLDRKPEDYMDEEDFGSFGIAPKRIHTKDDFVENISFAGLRDTTLSLDEVIRSVFKPTKESIGKRLFKRMRRKAKVDRKNVIFGDGDRGDEERRRPKQNSYEPKNNLHGLGYSGALNPENMLFGERVQKNEGVSATMASGRRLKITGEAFGIGALEDEDDMGVYSKDDMSQYDFEIGSLPALPASKSKKKKPSDPSRDELDGFRRSKTGGCSLFAELKRKYRPPELPRGWRPKRVGKAAAAVKRSRWDIGKDASSTESAKRVELSKPQDQPKLNANVRAVILGEEVVHRVGVARKPETSKKPELEFQRVQTQQSDLVRPASLKPLSAVLASKFTSSTSATHLEESISAGLTSFKDLASISAQAETLRQEAKDANKVEEVDRKPTRTSFEWHPHKLVCKRFAVQNPYPTFTDVVGVVCVGKEERTQNQLVMGRKSASSSDNSKRLLFGSLFQDLNTLAKFDPKVDETKMENFKRPEPVKAQDSPVEKENLKPEVEEEEKEEERKPRPPMDLFKSIFASDEEDDEEEEKEEEVEAEKPKEASRPNTGIFSGINFEEMSRNFDPKVGSAPDRTESQVNLELSNGKKIQEVVVVEDDNDEEDEGFYGPSLPPPPLSSSSSEDDSEDSSEEDRTDRKTRHHRSSKKRKKDKKSKKSSRKSKTNHDDHHQHSRKKKKKSKSSKKRKRDDSDSEDERYKVQILDLIKKARRQ